MSDENKTDEEPSIEEILSSIRDIISEDDEAEAAEEVKAADDVVESQEAPEDVEAVEEDDDVLELTDLADEEDGAVAEDNNDDPLAGIDLDHPEDNDLDVDDGALDNDALDDIFDGDEGVVEEEVSEEIDVFDAITTEDVHEEPKTDDALVDKIAETATVGAMAKLAENIAISRTKEGVTLEDVVSDLLRPMLKDWLDENLPSLIERLVSKELERLANKAAGK